MVRPRIGIVASAGLWLLAVGLLLACLPWHGLTWDLAGGDYLYGERTLAFLVLLPWAIARNGLAAWRRTAIGLVAFVAIMAATAFAVWPWLWLAPVDHGVELAHYIGGKQTAPFQFDLSALWDLAVMTPEPILVLLPLGIVVAWRQRERRADVWLLLLWLVVPVCRHVVLGVGHFDGIRHFLEVVPPLAAFAGLGGAAILARVPKRPPVLVPLLLAVFTVPLVVPLVCYFPWWTTYYNGLIGGLRGARASHHPAATDFWADSYREAIARVNRTAPPGARLAVPVAGHVAQAVRDVWLRRDIKLVSGADLVFARSAEPACVLFIERPSLFDAVATVCDRNLQAADAVLVQGVPVCRIFLLDPAQRAVFSRLGDNWRAAAAWLGREAPPRSLVITAEWDFAPQRVGPLPGRHLVRAARDVARLAQRAEELIGRQVFGVVPTVVENVEHAMERMRLVLDHRIGSGDEAVDIWRLQH